MVYDFSTSCVLMPLLMDSTSAVNIHRYSLGAVIIVGALAAFLLTFGHRGMPDFWRTLPISAQSDSAPAGSTRFDITDHGHFTVSDTSPSIGQTVTIETSLTGTDGVAARSIAVIISGYNGHFTSASSLTGSIAYYAYKGSNNGDESFEVTSSEARTMTFEMVAFGSDVSDGRYWTVYPDVFHITWAGTAPPNTATPTPTTTSVGAPTATPTPTPTATATATPTASPTATGIAEPLSCKRMTSTSSNRNAEVECNYPRMSYWLEYLVCRYKELKLEDASIPEIFISIRIDFDGDATEILRFLNARKIEYRLWVPNSELFIQSDHIAVYSVPLSVIPLIHEIDGVTALERSRLSRVDRRSTSNFSDDTVRSEVLDISDYHWPNTDHYAGILSQRKGF